MRKRNAGILLTAAAVLGGGAMAWAQGSPERPRFAAQEQPAPDADGDAVRACKEEAAAARVPGERPTAEQRKALKACLERAGVDSQHLERRRPGGGKHRHPGDGYLGRAVHGDLLVRNQDGAFETVTFDRGRAGAASTATTIVVEREDGQQVSFALTDATRYKGIEGAQQLRKGEPVMVVSKDDKALVVVQRTPREAKAKPGAGNNVEPAGVLEG